jgi:hypothetical protein
LLLKAKDARILEVEEELADVNWEMKARKEADYVTLLKDRKERKIELESTKKDLKKSEERVSDLERELEQLRQNQEDLERDVSELDKSLMARDSGDYVSGLKRQIRSLKEHNMTLERKIEIEESNAADTIEKKDETISSLEQEVKELKNPAQAAAQAAVRGMLKFASQRMPKPNTEAGTQIISDAGKTDEKDTEKASTTTESESVSQDSTVEKKDTVTTERRVSISEPPPTPGKRASIWNAFLSPFGGSKKNVASAPLLGRLDDEEDGLVTATREEPSKVENDDLESELKKIEQEDIVKAAEEEGSADNKDVEAELDNASEDDAVEAIDKSAEEEGSPDNNDVEAELDNASEDGVVETELLKGGEEKQPKDGSNNDDDSLEQAEDIDTDDEIDLAELKKSPRY